jgi:tight adherence protein B
VTAALLSGALALLLWPGRQAMRRGRLELVTGRPGRRDGPQRADVPVPVLAGLAACGVAAVLSTPLVAVLAGIAAFAAARTWTAARQDRQAEARLLAVTEGLGALAADLRSGRSVDAATASAVAACADEESGRALARAIRAPGASPGRDLRPSLDRVSAGVLLSSRTGCSLAAVVAAVEDDLRARHRQRLELRSATAAPRASALLLAGLPALGLAMGSGVGADPWAVLTTTGTGQVLLVAGVSLELAGVAWSRRLIAHALR